MPKTFLIAASLIGAPAALGKTDVDLTIAVGLPGTDSFTFGTELWAMTQIVLTPKHGISFEAREVADDTERLGLLRAGQVEAALIYEGVPVADARGMRAIMALWPEGQASNQADSVQLLVKKNIPDDVIYLVTKVIFDQSPTFKSAHSTLGVGSPEHAMTGLDVPIHPGAYRYYNEKGLGFDQPVASESSDQALPVAIAESAGQAKSNVGDRRQDGRSAASYSNFDDTALSDEESAQIEAACRQALDLGSLSPVLGDLSSTGCEIFHDRLTLPKGDTDVAGNAADNSRSINKQNPQQQSVAANDRGVLFQLPSGQGGPAIIVETEDGAARDAGPSDAESGNSQQLTRQPTM
ncbi:MAG: TAXI family TRAP transporter solute-binding subunit [Geminicoccaceae bacterium]